MADKLEERARIEIDQPLAAAGLDWSLSETAVRVAPHGLALNPRSNGTI